VAQQRTAGAKTHLVALLFIITKSGAGEEKEVPRVPRERRSARVARKNDGADKKRIAERVDETPDAGNERGRRIRNSC